jgi:hypothetical protein
MCRRALLSVVCVAAILATSATARAGWQIVPSSIGHGETFLSGVAAASTTDAWAVGNRNAVGGGPLAEHWNGTSWQYLPPPNEGSTENQLTGVAELSSSDVWAVGWTPGPPDTYATKTVTDHWNGSVWSIVPSPDPSTDPYYGVNSLYGVSGIASNNVWAVGYRYNGAFDSELILHWNGRRWGVAYSPNGGDRELSAVSADSSSDAWAVGYTFSFSSGDQPLVEHWNGTSWSIVASPQFSGGYAFLNSVAAISPTNVWAVGYSGSAPDEQPISLHWDGISWKYLPAPTTGTYNFLYGVAALGASDIWAVGTYNPNTSGGSDQTKIDHWDGVSWNQAVSPSVTGADNYLSAVASDRSGGAWAVGYSISSTREPPIATLILRATGGL